MERDLLIVFAVLGLIVYLAGGFRHFHIRGRLAQPGSYGFSTPGRNLRNQQLNEDAADRRELRRQADRACVSVTEMPSTKDPSESGQGWEETEDIPEQTATQKEEERARRAAAAAARLSKDKANNTLARKMLADRKQIKGSSALEQLSRENLGWRHADEAAEMRSWN